MEKHCAYCYKTGINTNVICNKCNRRHYCCENHKQLDLKNGHDVWCGKCGEFGYDYDILRYT